MQMKRMGLPSMILMCLNGTIGAGLFLLPGKLYLLTGAWGSFIYVLVSLIVLAIAWCFSKCAAVFQQNGGGYVYVREAFGQFIGFEIGIMRLVSGMLAYGALAAGFFTALGSIFPVVLTAPYKQIGICAFILSLASVNLFSVRAFQSLNNLVTLAKLLPLLGLIFLGFFFIEPAHLFDFQAISFDSHAAGSGALLIFFALTGFETLTIAASEMKNPQKNVPIAMMVALAISAFVYLLAHLLCMGLLGPQLSESETPFADIAQVLFGAHTQLFVAIAVLVAIGGVTIVTSFIIPRIGLALARDQIIPRYFDKINAYGSPHRSVIVTAVITCALAVSGTFEQLVIISVISRFAQYVAVCLALYTFDRRGTFKPFNKPWKKAIPIFGLTGIGWLLFHTSVYELTLGCGALVCALPFYFLQRKKMLSQSKS